MQAAGTEVELDWSALEDADEPDTDYDKPLPKHINADVLDMLENAAKSYRAGHHRAALDHAVYGIQALVMHHDLNGGAWL